MEKLPGHTQGMIDINSVKPFQTNYEPTKIECHKPFCDFKPEWNKIDSVRVVFPASI